MNTLGIALVWCIVQVTLLSLLACGLYLLFRRFRPAAAVPVVLASLMMVMVLSLLTLSPWPRWNFWRLFQSADKSSIALGASTGDSGEGNISDPGADRLKPEPVNPEISLEDVKPTFSESNPFLQSVVEGLTEPSSVEAASGWRWPEVVALLLLAAMASGVVWLILGVLAVRRQRLRSRPIHDGPLLELVDVLCAELNCLRSVEVRQSDELVTAATIGWHWPVLLLPADWTKWTPEQRRAVLAHEIAHARSHDFLALLCGQLGLMLHFYHPVVHWLMNRLRLEQELAADAAAASISGGQRQYLTTIAELALSQQDRPLPWPARSFLPTRNTFLRRIAMLRDSKLRIERLSPIARTLTVGVIVMSGLLVAGLRGPVGPQPASAADAVIPVKQVPTTPAEDANREVAKKAEDAKQPRSENILLNSGMENGEEYAGNWLQGPEIEGVKYSWDKNVAFEGKASLCIEKTVNRYFPIAGWSQTFDRKGDMPFLDVSAQVKTKKMFKAVLDVIFLDGNDMPISHEWAAYIGDKTGSSPPANHDWKKYTGIVKIPEGTAKISVALQDYGPGKVWFDDIQARYAQSKTQTSAAAESDNIIEGVGWGKVKLGMSRHDLLEVLGNPNNDPASDWLRWNDKHIECTFHTGATGVSEVRFDPGFKAALANGIKVGSPAGKVQECYGEMPTPTIVRDNGAKEYAYSDKGILLWTHEGKITQIVVFKPYNTGSNTDATQTPDGEKIIEGVGWGKVRVGMNRHDLFEALGNPDNDPASEWPNWNQKHIECSLHPGGTEVAEIRFNPGFQGSLANGVKLGSPAGDVQKFYGNNPTNSFKRDNGAQQYEFGDKGIMLWTYQGKITQIIVMKPSKAGNPPASNNPPANETKTSQSTGNVKTLSYVGESGEDRISFADSGYAVLFERPADMKSIKAVKVFGSRYGTPRAPAEKFHIYLLDENKKVLEHILVPYGKVQRSAMKWYVFEFPPVQVPEKFFVAFWFDAEATKGVYVGKDQNIKESHSYIGLPDTGYEKVEELYDWMIRAEVSEESGKTPSYPTVKTYGEEDAGNAEIAEISKKRIWNDASGAFSLEAEFVKVEDGNVTLKKTDGKTITIPLDKLSQEDRDFVAKQSNGK